MNNNHLHVSVTLCHILQRRKETPIRFEMPDQVSNTIWIFYNRAIFSMRKPPMKRPHGRTLVQRTWPMIGTQGLGFFWRTITPIRARWAIRVSTSSRAFSITIFGPIHINGYPRKTRLLPQNFCEHITHITHITWRNPFQSSSSASVSNPLALMSARSSFGRHSQTRD